MKQPKETPPTANDAAPAGRPEETQNRLKEILQVLARHDIVKGMTPEKLRNIVEDLGPTFVKLGQIMSMRQDMLPAAYCRELSKLRTEVSPMPFDEVRQVIEEEYDTRLERVFASFDRQPLGAASIAQAHAAVLRDGSPVVVKVQRQGIRDVMARDIQLLRKAARILKAASSAGNALDFGVILNEMWAVAQQEMDFLIEARNAGEFYKLNQDVAYVTCPQIHSQVTTSRVLVMEYIEGFDLDRPDILTDNGYDLEEIGLKLADNYVKQIIDDGFFHADPHPGNLRIREGQIVFLDLGMMGRLSQRDKALFRQAVRAIAEHNVNALKDVLLTLGVHNGRINHTRLYGDIEDLLTQYGSMGLADMDLGRMLEEFLGLANSHGISMPEGVTMLTRGMLTIQGVGRAAGPGGSDGQQAGVGPAVRRAAGGLEPHLHHRHETEAAGHPHAGRFRIFHRPHPDGLPAGGYLPEKAPEKIREKARRTLCRERGGLFDSRRVHSYRQESAFFDKSLYKFFTKYLTRGADAIYNIC